LKGRPWRGERGKLKKEKETIKKTHLWRLGGSKKKEQGKKGLPDGKIRAERDAYRLSSAPPAPRKKGGGLITVNACERPTKGVPAAPVGQK